MSTSTINKNYVSHPFKFMQLLEEAILKNTCPPRPGEKFTMSKRLRVSGEVEGDSQMGVLLFVGLSAYFNVARPDATDYIGIETEEYDYKYRKFNDEVVREENKRLDYKARLVYNYVKFYARERGILIRG